MSTAAMMLVQAAEARRRRDERGRYMGGGQDNNQYTHEHRNDMEGEMRDRPDMRSTSRRGEMRMGYAEGMANMRRPYNRRMEDGDPEMRRRGRVRSEMNDSPDMGGEGYFVWDGPDHLPPNRYGQPDSRQNVTDMRQYRTRSMMGEGGDKQHQQQGAIGFGEQDAHGKKLTKEKADKWVKHMRSDGHKGGMWTMEDAKELAKEYGIDDGQEMIDFYAALNMMHSDYCAIAKEYGVDREDFYAGMACAFLWDADGKGPSEKLAAYYKYVVPHEED